MKLKFAFLAVVLSCFSYAQMLNKIAYELAGGRVPAYPFWVFADENGKMLTHEGLLKEKELNSIFSNHNH